MAINLQLSRSQFVDLLVADEYASWTHDGAGAIFDALEDYCDDTGRGVEFDRVAIRGDFAEYASLGRLVDDYGHLLDDVETNDEQEVLGALRDEGGHVVELPSGGYVVETGTL